MSDRVATIGGSTAGRDHFPYTASPNIADIGSPSTGDYTQYPLGVDLSKACKWFYLVKWWALSIAVDYSIYDNDGNFVGSSSGTLYVEVSLPVNENGTFTAPSREAELIYPPANPWGIRIGGGTIQDNGSAATRAFNWAFSSDITHVSGQFAGGALLFLFYLSRSPVWDGSVFRFFSKINAVAGDLDYSKFFSDGSSGSSAGDTTVDGEIYPVNKEGAGTAGYGTLYILDAITASFNPVEWWPYKNNNGDPVYDTSDGSVLNDPLGGDFPTPSIEVFTQLEIGGDVGKLNVKTDNSDWVPV